MHPHAHLHPFVCLLLWHFLAYFISVWVYTLFPRNQGRFHKLTEDLQPQDSW